MSDSVALVTGGGSGIGRAVAAQLRDAGHDVVVWDLSGGDIDCDISDPDAVSAAMEQTIREHGVPTRVVNSAGIGSSGSVAEGDTRGVATGLSVNLTGTWFTIRAAAQAMIDAEVGARSSPSRASAAPWRIGIWALTAYRRPA